MKIIKILFGISFLIFISSCNEDEILKEESIDFYSTENSYVTEADFNLAINRLYDQVRNFSAIKRSGCIYTWTTDEVFRSNKNPDESWNSPNNTLVPSQRRVKEYWSLLYEIIYNANVILNRIDSENSEIKSDDARNLLKSEAKFFRAWAYRGLAGLYGGVPLVIEETTKPKRDYERATREETWQQCVDDLTDASEHLPDIDNREADGKISKAAAYQLLAEIYIALEQWDNAISTANEVINSGNFSLMTERFGTRADEPGDVYWDLFRRGNQNRSSGNTESIWVLQYEGFNLAGGMENNTVEKRAIPKYRVLIGPDDKSLFIGPTTQNCGRGAGFMQPNEHTVNGIWKGDWDNDIRNSHHNIRRDLVADNPASEFYGDSIIKNDLVAERDYLRNWYPVYEKASTSNNHPEELIKDKETGLLSGDAARLYRDVYAMRLAETYLLRAEAYLGKGNAGAAASDINVARNRANANPVDPSEVDIDYILDERTRELYLEGFRQFTLSRLGLNYERKSRYNDRPSDRDEISPHHNLWPIPYSEIERNLGQELEQNPGY